MQCLVKIFFCITFTTSLTCFTGSISAQEPVSDSTYSLAFNRCSIQSILDSIRNKTHYGFSYNPDYLKTEKLYLRSFENTPLKTILDSVFNFYQLNYQIVGSTIAISPVSLPVADTKATNLQADTITHLHITGTIEDNHGQPIAYANVFIKNRPIGSISNTDGKFILTIPVELINDSIQFSFLGFKTEAFLIGSLLSTENKITLTPYAIPLKEVVIRYINPKDVLQKAIENIPKNYSISPQLLTAFYRETVSQNGRYVVLSEAVLKIFKATYNSYQNDQVTVFKGRKIPLSSTLDTISFKLQGGIVNSLLLDIAKHHSNFMSGENAELYNYSFERITTVQGHGAYIIDFDQKENTPYSLFKGKIYIDTASYAIVKAEFSLSEKGIGYAAQTMVQKSPRGVKVKPTDAYYLVNYFERNNKWYLSNIREEVKFKVRKRLNLFNINFHSEVEMVITHSDTLNVKRFKYSEIVKSTDVFTETPHQFDPDFWKKFNYIPPDVKLEEALKDLMDKFNSISL